MPLPLQLLTQLNSTRCSMERCCPRPHGTLKEIWLMWETPACFGLASLALLSVCSAQRKAKKSTLGTIAYTDNYTPLFIWKQCLQILEECESGDLPIDKDALVKRKVA